MSPCAFTTARQRLRNSTWTASRSANSCANTRPGNNPSHPCRRSQSAGRSTSGSLREKPATRLHARSTSFRTDNFPFNLKSDQLTQLRLLNQQIAFNTCRKPAEVVRHLGAMQAQDYPGALWSIGLRLPNGTQAEVEHAIAERHIVRTWPMRGTLHFVAAEDVHWMLKHLTSRIVAGAARRQEQLELDRATFKRSEKVWVKALAGGRLLSRSDMLRVLGEAGIPVDPHRGYHLLWRLAQEGVLCFGPRQSKEPTFTLLDEWITAPRMLERDEALGELARRYFASHGPAGVRDFAWWAGLTAADAKTGIALASVHLAKETIDGKEYWAGPTAPCAAAKPAPGFLLPGFDKYMLGYQDRSAALPPLFAQKIVPGGNGIFLPTLISKGQVVGTWKRATTKKGVVLTPVPFGALGKAQLQAFAKAASRYGHFLGLQCSFAELA